MSTEVKQAKNGDDHHTPDLPTYLMSPVRELRGFELARKRLYWKFNRTIGRRNQFSFTNSRFYKYGSRVYLAEALTMDFIARNTTICVPRVLDVFSVDGDIHIVQEFIKGPVLEDVWHKLTPDQQQSSMAQVKDCLDQLRALKPPQPGRVQAIDRSGCVDGRLAPGKWGPFDDHTAFHKFLGYEVFRDFPERYPLLQDALHKLDGREYRTVFAHGDLGPHNLLWKDGKIVVIDWERSGWFPEYWDYTRTYAARGYTMPHWWEMFKGVVDRYDDEVEFDLQVSGYVERF